MSFKEAMAYQQSTSASSAPAASSELRLMQQLMKLMHAYRPEGSSASSSTLSVTA